MKKVVLLLSVAIYSFASVYGQTAEKALKMAASVEAKVIEWRHHIHENPELSNREFKTSEYVAAHLRSLGIEVKTGIAHTGVVGILKGAKPGPVIGLRADMDALPVTERVNLPWASKVKTTFNDMETGVMHACGHDTHVAILMGVAEILSKMKNELSGTVKFVFQPAEEGAPKGEEGGAKLMIKEGVLENPKVEAMFGLHISSSIEVGKIEYRPEGMMAAADRFYVTIKGKQSHGAYPWYSIDPIVVSSQVVMALQTIVSRRHNLTENIAIVTVGSIHAGIRNNIIPESAEMQGTIRTFDPKAQEKVHENMHTIISNIAESADATAEITIEKQTPVTYNHVALTAKCAPVLERTIGKDNLSIMNPTGGAEDFGFFGEVVPSFFFNVGGRPTNIKEADAAPHHTPDFYVDDAGLITGIKATLAIALDYLEKPLQK